MSTETAIGSEIRALFPGLTDTIYMNTATMAVGCAPAREAYERATRLWTEGRFDWIEAERAGEDARAMFAQIVGASPEEIAIVPAVSVAAGIVAANLPDAAPGENVLVAGGEFSSNYFPWLLLRERGYDVRVVQSGTDGVDAKAFDGVADGGTRLIAVSAVHSPTGYRTNLADIRAVASRSAAWLFVDACQAAGAVPVDVVRDGIDFLAVSSHKFLLGSRGMGYLYVRRGLIEKMRPIVPGWKAARTPLESFYGPAMDLSPTASRLDASLVWFAALAEQSSLGIFRRFGIQALLDRNARLAARLHDVLNAHQWPASRRSTIVSVPVTDTDALMTRLRQANVVASVRAGRVRLSIHFYNLDEEIDRVGALVRGA